jgi:hypothetical protein
MYEIKTKDVYEDFRRIGLRNDCWDNSDYPKDSPHYSTHNKKVIGKFKDEAAGVPIIEFVGLRSKMYSYIKENGGGGMTAKCVKRYVIRNKLTQNNFIDVINTKGIMRHSMNTIRSKKHNIGTYEMKKITLSCFDDKRYLLEDGVTSYAYGHHKIEDIERSEYEYERAIQLRRKPVEVDEECKRYLEKVARSYGRIAKKKQEKPKPERMRIRVVRNTWLKEVERKLKDGEVTVEMLRSGKLS